MWADVERKVWNDERRGPEPKQRRLTSHHLRRNRNFKSIHSEEAHPFSTSIYWASTPLSPPGQWRQDAAPKPPRKQSRHAFWSTAALQHLPRVHSCPVFSPVFTPAFNPPCIHTHPVFSPTLCSHLPCVLTSVHTCIQPALHSHPPCVLTHPVFSPAQ